MNHRKLEKIIKRLKYLPKNRYFFLYTWNKFLHVWYKLVKSKKVAYPSNVMIELTNHCNLHCTTCAREYEYGQKMDKGFIKLDQAKKIIDELWPYLDSVGLTGMGETFMYKEIAEIVDYIHCKNKGIIISLSTNAMLPNFLQIVTPLVNKVDTIQISIDGIGEVYENIRKNARFDQLNNNLNALVSLCKHSQTSLMLNMVVTKENYFQMTDLAKYTNEIGIRFINYNLLNLSAVTNIDVSYYDFYQSEHFLKEFSKLDKIKNELPGVEITHWDIAAINEFQKCPFPWSHFYISWDGFVVPCCAKPFPHELHFGNVFENKVMHVLNGEKFQAFRALWFANNAPEFCNKCQFIDLKPVVVISK